MNAAASRIPPMAAVLMLLMLATRHTHVAAIQDASWAVFFLAGALVADRRFFFLLMAEAVAVDASAIAFLGVSNYCMTPAYPAVLAGYGALYGAGRWWHSRGIAISARSLGLGATALLAATSVCFALTDSAFYWFGGHHAHPDVAGWARNFVTWYPHFLFTPFAYSVGVLALRALAVRAFGTTPITRRQAQHG